MDFACRLMNKKTGPNTCFSSCSRPEACQTGRISSLVYFQLKSSGGRRAWASPCMYLWYWSPANGHVDKRPNTQKEQRGKQMLGHRSTHGGMRESSYSNEQIILMWFFFFFFKSKRESVCATESFYELILYHLLVTHSVRTGGGTTKPSLSCSLSQGSVKTLPASSGADCCGTLKCTAVNSFYRITSRPVKLCVALSRLVTILGWGSCCKW